MGEILGITISDFPFHRLKPQFESGVIQSNQALSWKDKPELNDPKNWPHKAQELWANDQGWSAAITLQREQIGQFRKVRQALDDFQPDAILLIFRDLGETWGPPTDPNSPRPKYWLHLQDSANLTMYNWFGNRQNYFEEDPDKITTVPFHREATKYLIDQLGAKAPVPPQVATETKAPLGMGHNFVAGVVHTDWDEREYQTPYIAVAVDPFGFGRTRTGEGLSPWDKRKEAPLTPKEAFDIGRVLARAIKESPWRIALVGDCDWSHANDHPREAYKVFPSLEADRRRFEDWKSGGFKDWGENWTFEEMEANGQWQILITIVVAGAMTEVGSKIAHADFQENTDIFNDGMVTTIFEPK